jgi:hypothetical protein
MKRKAERRSSKRVACVVQAYVVDNDSSIIECSLIDLSVSGARLKVPYASNIQSQVTLCVPSKGIERQIDVVWRSGNEVGIVFSMNILGSDNAIVPQPKVSQKPIPVAHLRKMVLETLGMSERVGPEAETNSGQPAYVQCVLTSVIAGAGAAANILFGFGRF